MPLNNKKHKWTPLKIDFNRTENESTTAKDTIDSGATQNNSQRPELAEFEERGNAESEVSGKASSKESKSKDNPSSWISEASPTSGISAHDGERKDRDEPCDSGDEDDIGAEFENGKIERDHRTRATGRKLEYHKRYNTSQRNRK